MDFASDNSVGAHPRVLEMLSETNSGAQHGYGEDPLTERSVAALADLFGTQTDQFHAFPVITGTAANSLAIAATTPPYGVVLCHAEAHIATDEASAPSFFSGGAEMRKIYTTGPKITPDDLRRELATFNIGVHCGKPTLLSITNASEMGSVYTVDELSELANIAHENDVKVHLDCARGSNAVVALDTTWAEMTKGVGADIVSFGATKNGVVALDVVVCWDDVIADEVMWRRKNSGHLVSKGRFFAAQLQAYLDDDLWRTLATHANQKATELANVITADGRARLPWGQHSNEVFAVVPDGLIGHLQEKGVDFYDWPNTNELAGAGEGETLCRFVASWSTTSEEVENFAAVLAAWT